MMSNMLHPSVMMIYNTLNKSGREKQVHYKGYININLLPSNSNNVIQA